MHSWWYSRPKGQHQILDRQCGPQENRTGTMFLAWEGRCLKKKKKSQSKHTPYTLSMHTLEISRAHCPGWSMLKMGGTKHMGETLEQCYPDYLVLIIAWTTSTYLSEKLLHPRSLLKESWYLLTRTTLSVGNKKKSFWHCMHGTKFHFPAHHCFLFNGHSTFYVGIRDTEKGIAHYRKQLAIRAHFRVPYGLAGTIFFL